MATIHVLGAGTPTPTAARFGSAYVVQLGGEYLMFDCGPAATHKLVKAGLAPTQIGYLFFTHHHFDHDVDYPCFLLCRWDQSIGGEQPLQVFGPALTETITARILGENGAFAHDWKARVNHPLSQQVYVNRGGTLPRPPPSPRVKDVGPGLIAEGAGWRITAAPAEHVQPWLDSLAYRLDGPDGSIVFTGDTQPCPSVVELARGADLMLCQCWGDQAEMDRNGENQGNCGTTGAGRMAQEAAVKRLVLTHTSEDLATRGREQAIEDVRRVYSGEVVFADELMRLQI